MNHDASLERAYRETAYQVRLVRGGRATIRIGQILPEALQVLAADAGWAFLTAWNPGSRPCDRLANRRAQRALLQALAADGWSWRPAIGAGREGWHEPSLWIPGLPSSEAEKLARRFGQCAWVEAGPRGRACLRYSGIAARPQPDAAMRQKR